MNFVNYQVIYLKTYSFYINQFSDKSDTKINIAKI